MSKDKKEKSAVGRIFYIIILMGLIILAMKLLDRYKINNFNEFIRMEYNLYTSEFVRDDEIKYSESSSYKITSNEENDALFYKTVEVKPNTPYKVTCMVKTENVKTMKEVSNGGAHICITDTVEKSESITGTSDWQKLEFIFNSKDRTSVDIGFRLGGYDDNCTGTAWFSDFTMEVGVESNNSIWNVACFVIQNTDVEIEKNGQINKINLTMDSEDIAEMRQNMSRFKTSCEELSHNKMKVTYDFITISEPLTSLSYDSSNGYHAAPANVKELIGPYLEKENYDHIFVCVRLGDDAHQDDIPVYDWIGLGGMDYLGIGFSNIRLPNDDRSYAYKYDSRVNTFPEEVFIHEFLHSLERNAEEYGYERPQLHDYSKYGYKEQTLTGLKDWYEDYMNCTIKTDNGNVGLPSEVYKLKPNNNENFQFSYKMDVFDEPENIIEEIKMMINKAVKNTNKILKGEEENTL